MYPYIWSVPLLGIWIVCTILLFCFLFYRQSIHHGLSTTYFSQHLWYFILWILMSSTYVFYLLEQSVFLPLHWKQFLLYLSPFDFQVHIVGTIIWIAIMAYMLYKSYPFAYQKRIYITIFFDAYMISSIVFGVFLLLTDNFYGIGISNGFLLLKPLTIHSQWAAYDAVQPLWLFVSFLSLIVFVIISLLRHSYPHRYIEFLGWSVWSLGMVWISALQNYPRHIVTAVFGTSFDVKQYMYILISIIMIIFFFIFLRKENRLDQ